mmetsp:Transcript_19326/g.46073  ORF Transcript_19326/g.46073 Transcript_19326/m.46073 type:complete len:528 (-) Transcript_19326:234-1817(-)
MVVRAGPASMLVMCAPLAEEGNHQRALLADPQEEVNKALRRDDEQVLHPVGMAGMARALDVVVPHKVHEAKGQAVQPLGKEHVLNRRGRGRDLDHRVEQVEADALHHVLELATVQKGAEEAVVLAARDHRLEALHPAEKNPREVRHAINPLREAPPPAAHGGGLRDHHRSGDGDDRRKNAPRGETSLPPERQHVVADAKRSRERKACQARRSGVPIQDIGIKLRLDRLLREAQVAGNRRAVRGGGGPELRERRRVVVVEEGHRGVEEQQQDNGRRDREPQGPARRRQQRQLQGAEPQLEEGVGEVWRGRAPEARRLCTLGPGSGAGSSVGLPRALVLPSDAPRGENRSHLPQAELIRLAHGRRHVGSDKASRLIEGGKNRDEDRQAPRVHGCLQEPPTGAIRLLQNTWKDTTGLSGFEQVVQRAVPTKPRADGDRPRKTILWRRLSHGWLHDGANVLCSGRKEARGRCARPHGRAADLVHHLLSVRDKHRLRVAQEGEATALLHELEAGSPDFHGRKPAAEMASLRK